MNNNRNNNRRRGRGNNRQQGGGGQQLNRIDSRARGNAPQMLEKFKKMAQDAHMNGDRVQAEYYLQFADHYFRVIADTRLRQEENRVRRDERFPDSGFEENEDGEFGGENDIPGFDQPMNYRRDDAPREPRREENGRDGGRDGREPRAERPRRERNEEVSPREEPVAEAADDGEQSVFEPEGGNPFTRGNRAARGGLRPRRDREERNAPPVDDAGGLDPAALPPAISDHRDAAVEDSADEAPVPRRRGRPRRAAGDDADGSLEAVNG